MPTKWGLCSLQDDAEPASRRWPTIARRSAAPRAAGQTPPFNAHRSRLRGGSVHAIGCGVLPARFTVRELLIARRIQPIAYDTFLPWI